MQSCSYGRCQESGVWILDQPINGNSEELSLIVITMVEIIHETILTMRIPSHGQQAYRCNVSINLATGDTFLLWISSNEEIKFTVLQFSEPVNMGLYARSVVKTLSPIHHHMVNNTYWITKIVVKRIKKEQYLIIYTFHDVMCNVWRHHGEFSLTVTWLKGAYSVFLSPSFFQVKLLNVY